VFITKMLYVIIRQMKKRGTMLLAKKVLKKILLKKTTKGRQKDKNKIKTKRRQERRNLKDKKTILKG
jgi:hypothetical protein